MVERTRLPIDTEEHSKWVSEFLAWYKQARPLEMYVYYHGGHLHETLAVERVKDITWDYACRGKIYLFAKRDKELYSGFFFICQKSKEANPRLIPAKTAKEIVNV